MKIQRSQNQKPFAKKSFGQNFLVDETVIKEIIAELDLQPNEIVVEIGAGRGALTRSLSESGARILAIEFDQDLIPVLQREFAAAANLKIIQADALKIDFREILQKVAAENLKVKVVANLPYNISTAILQRLIEQRSCFSELVLMLQREVVERIVAPPETSERGYLSILVEAYAHAEKLFDVPPTAFRPIPQVWSSVVKLAIKEIRLITDSLENEKLFWQLVGICFAQKRKTILNNLKNTPADLSEKILNKKSAAEILATALIEPNRRAESLTIKDWILLFNAAQELTTFKNNLSSSG